MIGIGTESAHPRHTFSGSVDGEGGGSRPTLMGGGARWRPRRPGVREQARTSRRRAPSEGGER